MYLITSLSTLFHLSSIAYYLSSNKEKGAVAQRFGTLIKCMFALQNSVVLVPAQNLQQTPPLFLFG